VSVHGLVLDLAGEPVGPPGRRLGVGLWRLPLRACQMRMARRVSAAW